VPTGLFLSTVVFLIVQQTTSDAAFLSWGWRIPFLLSVVLIAIGLFVRLRLYESPAFQRVKETQTEAPMPIMDVLRKYPREVLLAMGIRIAEDGTFYTPSPSGSWSTATSTWSWPRAPCSGAWSSPPSSG
jgi:MFS transporter, MHS family, shikimate and dehydroshikimate transport protein